MEEPEEKYPQDWSYRLICVDEKVARKSVTDVFGERAYKMVMRNTSAKGKFISMDLNCEVFSEEDRKGLNKNLLMQPGIRMIL